MAVEQLEWGQQKSQFPELVDGFKPFDFTKTDMYDGAKIVQQQEWLRVDPQADKKTISDYPNTLTFLNNDEKKHLLNSCITLFKKLVWKKVAWYFDFLGSTTTPFNAKDGLWDWLLDIDIIWPKDVWTFFAGDFKKFAWMYNKLNTKPNRHSLCDYMNALFRTLYEGKEEDKNLEQQRKTLETKFAAKIIFTAIDFEWYNANTSTTNEKSKQLVAIDALLSWLPNDMKQLLQEKTIYIGAQTTVRAWHVSRSKALPFYKQSIFISGDDPTSLKLTLAHELMYVFDFHDDKGEEDNSIFTRINQQQYKGEEFNMRTYSYQALLNYEDALQKLPWGANKGMIKKIENTLFLTIQKYHNDNGLLYKNRKIQVSDIIKNWKLEIEFEQSISGGLDKDFRIQWYVSIYASKSPDEDQAYTAAALLNWNPKELLERCKTDEILRKKIMAISGCLFDVSTGKFMRQLTDDEYKTLTWSTSEYFKKRSKQASATYWNHKFGKF